MSDLSWCPSQLMSINHFNVNHTCQICRESVSERQTECCGRTNFVLNLKLRITVSWDKGQFEMIAKSEEVARVLFEAQSDKVWNMWLDAFRKIRSFYFNKLKDYNSSFDTMTPVKLKIVKQLISTYLKAFNNRAIHHYDLKCRKFKISFWEDRYFCVMARPTEEEYLTLEKVLSEK